jgi:hypothetical protein
MRPLTEDEWERIPGLRLLVRVGEPRREATAAGWRVIAEGVARVATSEPILRGRVELTHVVLLEASNNLSHWMTMQVPEVAGVAFKPPMAMPRAMGRPPLVPDTDIPVRGELWLQRRDGRWRAEVEVCFFRDDGSRAETVSFPLVERLAVR